MPASGFSKNKRIIIIAVTGVVLCQDLVQIKMRKFSC